ncbi:MAG: hypothetical protein JWQ25_1619 [Daejeonella sp.]|nr:hypothetical protein [Daejeonella sp.]
MIKLAIVIPYFKLKYFEESLLSIKNQTDKRFKLYIGNDNSPESPIQAINDIFPSRENITYKHFDFNLGSLSLTRHWERCINLSSEEYVWLFSDDDIMPQDAVERFYKLIESSVEADLFRFNINIINELGIPIFPVSEHPIHETAISFLTRRLNGDVISSACEYIFSREVYSNNKGFVEFPLAWASDDATWLNYSNKLGIFLIPGKCVSWRMGGNNISSKINNYKRKTIACIAFIKFIDSKYSVKNTLKLKWLISQINLLGDNRLIKAYFWSQIFLRHTLPIGFVVSSFRKISKNFLV